MILMIPIKSSHKPCPFVVPADWTIDDDAMPHYPIRVLCFHGRLSLVVGHVSFSEFHFDDSYQFESLTLSFRCSC